MGPALLSGLSYSTNKLVNTSQNSLKTVGPIADYRREEVVPAFWVSRMNGCPYFEYRREKPVV